MRERPGVPTSAAAHMHGDAIPCFGAFSTTIEHRDMRGPQSAIRHLHRLLRLHSTNHTRRRRGSVAWSATPRLAAVVLAPTTVVITTLWGVHARVRPPRSPLHVRRLAACNSRLVVVVSSSSSAGRAAQSDGVCGSGYNGGNEDSQRSDHRTLAEAAFEQLSIPRADPSVRNPQPDQFPLPLKGVVWQIAARRRRIPFRVSRKSRPNGTCHGRLLRWNRPWYSTKLARTTVRHYVRRLSWGPPFAAFAVQAAIRARPIVVAGLDTSSFVPRNSGLRSHDAAT